jgi:hydroxyacid-oxoacid transhydrogenase
MEALSCLLRSCAPTGTSRIHLAMSCCHGYGFEIEDGESAFAIDASAVTFGPGVLREAGDQARALGCGRVALFTDATLAKLEHVDVIRRSLREAGVDVALYDEVHVEPTDTSFLDAAAFARDGKFDGYVSVGGGSVIDTCKAAILYATYPAGLLAYVNKPIGEGRVVPGALPPHVACPTTCGTGSECTGIAVFDYLALKAKTGIASRRLRPTHALVDPTATLTLPAMVVAASGFDVLCHALESFTARAYTARRRPERPSARPLSQGRNPWSDLGSREALRLAGKFIERAVRDASDVEAREALSWAATLAGIAFGNSGVHLPHAMSYSVAGLVREYRCEGYPAGEAMVPHGISVVVGAPSVFRVTARALPERHLEAAGLLGADLRGARPDDGGELLAGELLRLMRATSVPMGLRPLGYDARDLNALTRGAIVQSRLVENAPVPIDEPAMRALFQEALVYSQPTTIPAAVP